MTIFTDRSSCGDWVGSKVADEANPTPESSGTVRAGSGAGACAEGSMQRAFQAARLILAVSMHCCSYAAAPLWFALCYADRFCASVSHELQIYGPKRLGFQNFLVM